MAAVFLQMLMALAPLQVVDRVAVVVGNQVITESEVLQELRLEEFMQSEPLDLGPQKRLAAANRLVEQQLIRQEIAISNYQAPAPAEADAMLKKYRQEHFITEAAFRAALKKYSITEQDLKKYLLWQLTVIRFTDQRFQIAPAEPSRQGSADRQKDVDTLLDAWLKQARSSTRIVYKKEAFQ